MCYIKACTQAETGTVRAAQNAPEYNTRLIVRPYLVHVLSVLPDYIVVLALTAAASYPLRVHLLAGHHLGNDGHVLRTQERTRPVEKRLGDVGGPLTTGVRRR